MSNYPELKTYLEDTDRKAKFDFAGFNCSLGPNGAFYINNSGSGQYHRKLDPSLQKELDRRVNEEGLWPYDPTHVALGLDGAFVLVGKKGDLFWDLKGKYAFLEKKLQETKQRVKVKIVSEMQLMTADSKHRLSLFHRFMSIVMFCGMTAHLVIGLQRIGICQ